MTGTVVGTIEGTIEGMEQRGYNSYGIYCGYQQIGL